MTRQKIVWLNASRRLSGGLERTCHLPPEPSSSKALEAAATASFRFSAFLRKESSVNSQETREIRVPVLRRRVLTSNCNSPLVNSFGLSVDEPCFTQLVLVPGGRFLVAVLEDVFVQVFDLTFSDLSTSSPMVNVASFHLNAGCALSRMKVAATNNVPNDEITLLIALQITYVTK